MYHLDLENTKTEVYTTAHYTDMKLAVIEPLFFLVKLQSLETDVVISVDAEKNSNILGMENLTDASAETF
jgi:hypothetical protein